MEWWQDVDGRGTTMDQWMTETIAPLLLVLGQLDICLDHPPVPAGEEVRSRADEMRLSLDAVVATYILPENIFWWTLDSDGDYEEILIREIRNDQSAQWCYWNDEVYARYDSSGKLVGTVSDHDYGEVPIIRVFDRRRPRSRNVGLPRYEMVAEMQREYYNRDSELILSDTTQAHPLLQGPEDFVQPDGTIPMGPNWLLPKKKNMAGATAVYEGFEVIEFPKGGADSIRMNLDRLRDGVDRLAGLTKPAGAAGTQGQTVSQSGISKQLDADVGHDLLGNISKTLQRAEQAIAKLFWFVEGNPGDPQEDMAAKTKIQYATEFNLQSAQDIGSLANRYQEIIGSGGKSPLVEGKLIERFVRQAISGLDDAEYAAMTQEIQAILAQGQEMEQATITANRKALGIRGTAELESRGSCPTDGAAHRSPGGTSCQEIAGERSACVAHHWQVRCRRSDPLSDLAGGLDAGCGAGRGAHRGLAHGRGRRRRLRGQSGPVGVHAHGHPDQRDSAWRLQDQCQGHARHGDR